MSNDTNKYFTTYEISSEMLKKMQEKMLDILLYFKEFCDKHSLMFYLIGGGAIGAVREHGFVPWDDDVDCLMPEPDYLRFFELWNKYGDKERFVLCKTDRNVNYHHSSASLRDPNTTFICSYNQYSDLCHGISLEFGPIVPTPDNKLLQYKQILYSYIYNLFNFQRLPNNRGKAIRVLTKVFFVLVPSKRMKDNIWIWADKKIRKYAELWDSCKYVKELWGRTAFYNFPKEWFESVVWFDFEGYKMPLPAGYHEYLTLIFGNYMQRPPVPERIAKHDLIFVDMDHPYTDYKGIYYFPDKNRELNQ